MRTRTSASRDDKWLIAVDPVCVVGCLRSRFHVAMRTYVVCTIRIPAPAARLRSVSLVSSPRRAAAAVCELHYGKQKIGEAERLGAVEVASHCCVDLPLESVEGCRL